MHIPFLVGTYLEELTSAKYDFQTRRMLLPPPKSKICETKCHEWQHELSGCQQGCANRVWISCACLELCTPAQPYSCHPAPAPLQCGLHR